MGTRLQRMQLAASFNTEETGPARSLCQGFSTSVGDSKDYKLFSSLPLYPVFVSIKPVAAALCELNPCYLVISANENIVCASATGFNNETQCRVKTTRSPESRKPTVPSRHDNGVVLCIVFDE